MDYKAELEASRKREIARLEDEERKLNAEKANLARQKVALEKAKTEPFGTEMSKVRSATYRNQAALLQVTTRLESLRMRAPRK